MAANVERAECSDDAPTPESIAMLPAEEVYTPDTKTIEEVAAYLGIDIEQTIKALLLRKYDDEGNEDGFVAAFIRGDRELNMIKLVNALGIAEHQIDLQTSMRWAPLWALSGGLRDPWDFTTVP